MTLRKKVLTGILIVVLVVAFAVFFIDEYFNYAKVDYYLSGPTYVGVDGVLQVNLYLYDAGSVNVVPNFTVRVVNATIQSVSIPSVAANNLSDFSWFNGTTAFIENITASAKANSDLWAIVYVVPNSGVSSFSIFSDATIPFNVLHIRNVIASAPPNEVSYNLTSSSLFMRSLP
jgi:hypothetical protein